MYASLNALGARMSNQRLHSHPQLAPIPALLPAPAVNSKARSLLLLLLSASLAAAQQQQSQAGQQQQAALQLPLLLLVTALPLHSRQGVRVHLQTPALPAAACRLGLSALQRP
jgi:hypothetical protein